MELMSIVGFVLILFSQDVLVSGKSQLKDLNETTWVEMLNGEWFIQFYAPWCPACKQLAPIWKEFSEWSEDLSIQVGQVDVTNNPGLSGRFMISALPTVYHAKDGQFRLYTGARDKDALFSFVEDKKWTKIDPISRWSSPQSISMSTVAYFFQLSMTLRDAHNYLTGEMGLHSWTAHAVFGLGTILTGVTLGLLVVATIDFMYSLRRWMSSNGRNVKEMNDDGTDAMNEPNDMQPLMDEGIEDDDVEPPDANASDHDSGDSSESTGNVNEKTNPGSDTDEKASTVVHRKVTSSQAQNSGSGDEH